MSEFVDECRREWRRLGVPDPVANEMAADLTADLEEAEAEGGSPEDVLGNSAFDPRRFAAAWAVARGVTAPPAPERRLFWRLPVAIALTALLALLTVVAGVALLVGYHSSSFAYAVQHVAAVPGSNRIIVPRPGRMVIPGALSPPFTGRRMAEVGADLFAWVLFIVGSVGIVLLVVLYWLPLTGPRRKHESRTPSWN
ncbi:MAG: hypothetical protein ABSC41_19375 [Acidimicrobiales bacterium]